MSRGTTLAQRLVQQNLVHVAAPKKSKVPVFKPKILKDGDLGSLLGGYDSDDEDNQADSQMDSFLTEISALEKETKKTEEPVFLPGITDQNSSSDSDPSDLNAPPPGLSGPPPGLPPGLPLPAKVAGPPPGLPVDLPPPGLTKEVIEIDKDTDDFLKQVESLNESTPTDKEVKQKEEQKKTLETIEEITARVNEELEKASKAKTESESKRSKSKERSKKKKRKRKRDNSTESKDSKDSKSSKKRKKSSSSKIMWRQCKDEDTGKFYYWNLKTMKTTWEEPKEPFEVYTSKSKSKSRKRVRSSERSRRDKKKRRRSRSRKRSRERRRRKERSRSRGKDKKEEKKEKKKEKKEEKKEDTVAAKAKAIKTSHVFAKGTHSGLKSRIFFLRGEATDADMKNRLFKFTIELATRYEDWQASALATEYFVKKVQELGTKVDEIAKRLEVMKEMERATNAIKAASQQDELDVVDGYATKKRSKTPEKAAQSPEKKKVKEKEPEKEKSEEAADVLSIPFTFLRRHDNNTDKVYYENSQTKATTWDLPEGQSDWVDLTVLLFWLQGSRMKTIEDVKQVFADQSDITIKDCAMTPDNHVLICFDSEQDTWNALLLLKIEHKTPELTYSQANSWFLTNLDAHVRFLNYKDPPFEVIKEVEVISKPPVQQPQIQEKKAIVQPPQKVEEPQRKRKKKKFGGNKKLQSLAKKWAVVDKARAKEEKKKDPAYKAKQEKLANEKWVKEHSGRTADDNPNLIKVKDWRSKVGLKKL